MHRGAPLQRERYCVGVEFLQECHEVGEGFAAVVFVGEEAAVEALLAIKGDPGELAAEIV